jgi:hypothetical protein
MKYAPVNHESEDERQRDETPKDPRRRIVTTRLEENCVAEGSYAMPMGKGEIPQTNCECNKEFENE